MAVIMVTVIDGVITLIIMDTGVDIMARATTVMVTGTIITVVAMPAIMVDTEIIMGGTDTAIIPMHAIIVMVTMITVAGMGTVIQDMVTLNRIIVDITDHFLFVAIDTTQAAGLGPYHWYAVTPYLEAW